MLKKILSKPDIVLLFAVLAIFIDATSIIRFDVLATTYFLLLFVAFLALWAYVIWQKKVVLAVWIPTIILFLMGRPLAFILRGKKWTYFGQTVTSTYLLILLFTLGGIMLALYLNKTPVKLPKALTPIKQKATNFYSRFKHNPFDLEQIRASKFFGTIITLGYVVTTVCYLATKVTEWSSMQGKSYLDFYIGQQVTLPWLVTFLSSINVFFVCIMLSYVTKKRWVLSLLFINIASTVPTLLIGKRNPFILALIFTAIVIYVKNKRCWKIKLSKKTLITLGTVALVSLIALVLIMSAFASSRNGTSSKKTNAVKTLLSFVEDQGFTYEMLGQTISYRGYLRQQDKNYAFASVVDYYTYGAIGNKLLGSRPIPPGNNIARTHMSNDLAHKISYKALDKNYLLGAGLGTSYVAEAYIDYGFVGVLLFTLIFSLFLLNAENLLGKRLLVDTAILYAFMKIFFVGRDSIMSPVYELCTVHFFAVVAGLFILRAITLLIKKGQKNYEK